MSAASSPSDGTLLSCMICGGQQRFDLTVGQMDELVRRQELRLFCRTCGDVTTWSGYEADRRNGEDRRAIPHAKIELPIRVRCDEPGLESTEFTRTLTASRQGASFTSHHPLREGMIVYVVFPYGGADSTLLEVRARVVRAEKKGESYDVGIRFVV
jgi:hypothetical protein